MHTQEQMNEFKAAGGPQALLESQERYRILFNLAPVAVYSCDVSGVIREYNNRAAELWGRKPAPGDTDERFCGSFKMYRPDGSFMPHEQCPMGDVLCGKVPGIHDGEVHIERPDGSRVIVIVNIAPLKNDQGEIAGAINCFYDVTQRKQVEAAAAYLAAIVTSSSDAIIGKTLEGIVTSWNIGAQHLFGYAPEEMIGQSILRLIPPDRQDEEAEIIRKLRAGKRIEHYETVRLRKDGRPVEVSLTISPVKNSAGQIIGASKIVRDITERKKTELCLKESEERLRAFAGQLESLVEQRTAELTLSQERLRGLAAELNLTEQRERQKLASDLHDYLAQILALMRMKLDLTKQHPMENGLAKIVTEVQGLTGKALSYTRTLLTQLSPPVLQEFGLSMALQWLAEQMHERDLNVVFQAAEIPSLPEDQGLLLFQSVRELLLNCVKHAAVRQATLVLAQLNGSLHITVCDQGAGFDPGSLSAPIKADGSASRGFGLFSIRERMLSLGGRFELKSSPGNGTTATLVLPLGDSSVEAFLASHGSVIKEAKGQANNRAQVPDVTTVQTVQPSTSADSSTIRVLVADDHAMVRQGLCSLLKQYSDIQVVGEAANGEEVVAMADSLQPDVILMDVTMPKLDGLEATRRLKLKYPGVVVIGLSIYRTGPVEAAMIEAGAVAFVHKEAAVDELYQTIQTARRSTVPG